VRYGYLEGTFAFDAAQPDSDRPLTLTKGRNKSLLSVDVYHTAAEGVASP